MGLESIYPNPKTNKFNPEHKVYPGIERLCMKNRFYYTMP